jgi:hypothetical protein
MTKLTSHRRQRHPSSNQPAAVSEDQAVRLGGCATSPRDCIPSRRRAVTSGPGRKVLSPAKEAARMRARKGGVVVV